MSLLELQIARRYLEVCQAKGWPIHRKNALQQPPRSLWREEYIGAVGRNLKKTWQDLYIKRSNPWCQKLMPTPEKHIATETNFYLSQALSGIGCFGNFRHLIKKLDSPLCPCGTRAVESPMHLFTECTRFGQGRPVEKDISKPSSCLYLEKVVKELWILENGPQSVHH